MTSTTKEGKVLTMPYVSVSPTGRQTTPSRADATGLALDQLPAAELAAFFISEKFEAATAEAVVAMDLNAVQLRETCLSETADTVLETELGITSGLMRGKFKSYFTGAAVVQADTPSNNKPGRLAMEAMKKLKFPPLPKVIGKTSSINPVQ